MTKANPTGVFWMIPAGWLNDLPGVASRTLEALPKRHLTHGMNIYTLLDDAGRGIGAAAAQGWVGETDRQRRFPRIHHASGERRYLFGVGEGPAEAVAGAKQEWMGARPEFCVNFVSVATGKPLQAPLVTHLSTTCNPRF